VELRVKELEAFRAVYCGLCKQLGRSFGPLARLTLNYDFVFLAMLAYAQSDANPHIKRGRCAVNPFLGVPICKGDEVLASCADTAALMIYYNLRDKIDDGNIFLGVLRPFAASAKNKAAGRSPQTHEIIAELYKRQREVESQENVSIDKAAEPTATALSLIAANLTDDPGQKSAMERFGYMLGRYIYLADALEDLEADLKAGRFNPLAAVPEARERAKEALLMTAGEAGVACESMKLSAFEPVIHNVVYLGLREQIQRIYDRKKQRRRI
jgi:hypothetical protein